MKKLSVALISNILNPVGPAISGGLEVFNYFLANELEKKGVNVKLYASGDSAKMKFLEAIVPESLLFSRGQEFSKVPWNFRRVTVEEFVAFTKLVQKLTDKDCVLHFSSVNFLPVYLAIKAGKTVIQTLHMPAQNYHYQALCELLSGEELKRLIFVGISENQIKDFPVAHHVVHNGVDTEEFSFSKDFRDAYISLGRMIPEKGYDDAVDAAQNAKVKLEIAGKPCNDNEQQYLSKLKDGMTDGISCVGHVGGSDRVKFYKAKAFLFPPKWNEAFGLTMIEAMSCGTPVITYDRGAAREVVVDGKTGFIVPADDVKSLALAVQKIEDMSEAEYQKMRHNCREHVEENFSLSSMANKYIKLYEEINNAE